jgi:hypothetical protein
MLRAGAIALALAAIAHGAPLHDHTKGKLKDRQFIIGPLPSTTLWWGNLPTAMPTALPPGIPILTPPTTGIVISNKKRDDIGPILGGSDPSALKAHILDLELEYEHLLHKYGDHTPPEVAHRKKEIARELKKYGITIDDSPDGTTTTITPGKARRDGPVLGGSDPSALKAHILSLELEYEHLLHEYGDHAPPEVAHRKKEIAYELKKYGIVINDSPDGTTTTITPGKSRRDGPVLGGSDPSALKVNILDLELEYEHLLHEYGDHAPPEIAHRKKGIAYELKKYGITINDSPDGTTTTITPGKARRDGSVLGGSAPSDEKAHILDLEFEYEKLIHEYGKNGPFWTQKREKEIARELKKYGITIDESPDGTTTTITPGKVRRDGPILSGSEPSGEKLHILALEREYERLFHQFGRDGPLWSQRREKEIVKELSKYGISIDESPDGTTTTITPGKARRQATLIGSLNYDSAPFDLKGLEQTLETLMQQYGAHPPHDVYIVEEEIKHILLGYGITSFTAPDGTTTTIAPSTKRTTTATYDIAKLEGILQIALQHFQGATPPLANWLILQHITSVLESYGITVDNSGAVTSLGPSTKTRRQGTIGFGDSVDTVALQALLAMLEATYGTKPPRDIYLIEQAIATVLASRGIVVPGFTIPGGSLTPDPTTPGGGVNPDPTSPGGSLNPDPTTPGGALEPSTRRRDTAPPSSFSVAGLQAALMALETQYGTYGSGKIPVPVFIIMQNIVTILQAEGVSVPGWPLLGSGSTTIGPSS